MTFLALEAWMAWIAFKEKNGFIGILPQAKYLRRYMLVQSQCKLDVSSSVPLQKCVP